MLRLVFTVALVGLVRCDGLEKYVGNWTFPVMVYPYHRYLPQECNTVAIDTTPGFCTCGQGTQVPVMSFKGSNAVSAAKYPVIVVGSFEEAEEAVKQKCDCKDGAIALLTIFRSLTDDHFLTYPGAVDLILLVAKETPSQQELDNFVKNNDVLKDLAGSVYCVKETNAPHSSRKAADSVVKADDTPDADSLKVWLNVVNNKN